MWQLGAAWQEFRSAIGTIELFKESQRKSYHVWCLWFSGALLGKLLSQKAWVENGPLKNTHGSNHSSLNEKSLGSRSWPPWDLRAGLCPTNQLLKVIHEFWGQLDPGVGFQMQDPTAKAARHLWSLPTVWILAQKVSHFLRECDKVKEWMAVYKWGMWLLLQLSALSSLLLGVTQHRQQPVYAP